MDERREVVGRIEISERSPLKNATTSLIPDSLGSTQVEQAFSSGSWVSACHCDLVRSVNHLEASRFRTSTPLICLNAKQRRMPMAGLKSMG
jgi:hypothetical protein